MNTNQVAASSRTMGDDTNGGETNWLALSLAAMPRLAATELACAWALSCHATKRFALACALASRFQLVGDDIVLDHLACDRVGAVRRAARRARSIRSTRLDERLL